MRYRIKIVTYKTGRKEYFAEVKGSWFGWNGLGCDGDEYSTIHPSTESRERALSRIDKHFAGNTKVQTIEFEYITKNK